jgi:polyferredoxin
VRLTNLRKKLVRSAQPDHSQLLRRVCQGGFLLLNVWVGGAFYFWVRGFETGAHVATATRPAGVEGWLPIAGLMNFKYWAATGRIPATHPAAFFHFITFLAIAFLFRKASCSWLCPIGTLSEYLWRAGRQIIRRNFQLPRWIDIPLRGLKYLLLGFFVWAVANMSAEAIEQFMHVPYGAIANVRMLNFFRNLGETAAIACVLSRGVGTRAEFLVPLPVSVRSAAGNGFFRQPASDSPLPARLHRLCEMRQGPSSALPVDKLVTIKSAECTGCLECVAVCPAEGALDLSLPHWTHAPNDGRLPAWAMAVGIAALFVGIVGFAKAAGYWNGDVPDYVYRQLVPQANEVSHPAE